MQRTLDRSQGNGEYFSLSRDHFLLGMHVETPSGMRNTDNMRGLATLYTCKACNDFDMI